MCGIIGSVVTLAIGAVLVLGSCLIGYIWVPDIVKNIIVSETALHEDTIQLERFEVVPFAMNFTVKIFNITNPEVVMAGGVPVVNEIGPYVYKLYQTRELIDVNGDIIQYIKHEHFVFNPVLSYPNKEEDMLTIINVPYHAIIQVAERLYPSLMTLLNLTLKDVFGEYDKPFVTISVKELLFSGTPLCLPGPNVLASVACDIIRGIAQNARNIEIKTDGSLLFSILDYKKKLPSEEYEVLRGTEDPADLGRILTYGHSRFFPQWPNPPQGGMSVCNHINGTDSGIYAPFVDTSKSLYAINTDICRSVELRYEYNTEYEGIPAARFAANEWLLDNNEGCFCLNFTSGLNREDGCLLEGAMELYTCVGAFLVMSYPHFLFADIRYRDGVIGMRPNEEMHKIFLDIEPTSLTVVMEYEFCRGSNAAQTARNIRSTFNREAVQNAFEEIVGSRLTSSKRALNWHCAGRDASIAWNTGTPIRGAKRAQFNIFSRNVRGVPTTNHLRTTLVPILWVDESINLPGEFVDELTNRLLNSLRLVDIFIPVIIAFCCLILLVGAALTIRAKYTKGTNTNVN